MTVYLYPDSKIAANYNNTGGLVPWESLRPSGDKRFLAPILYGKYNPGQRTYALDNMPFFRGFPAVLNGEFAFITQAQLYYLKVNYLSSGYAGKVTMRLRLEDWATYVNVNCIFDLSTMDQIKKTNRTFEHYLFTLRKVTTLS